MKKGLSAASLRHLLRALLIWCFTALVLLIVSALILSRTGSGSVVLGYLSSAMSFLAALAAGLSLSLKKGSAFFFPPLLTAGFLILVLLTAGSCFGSLNPSGVLSVVSFTAAGVLLGALISRSKRSSGGRRVSRSKTRLRSGSFFR